MVKGGHDLKSIQSTLEEAFRKSVLNSRPSMPKKGKKVQKLEEKKTPILYVLNVTTGRRWVQKRLKGYGNRVGLLRAFEAL